ncbi:Ran-binding protein M homolog [Linum grandiflorum]
MVGAVPKDIDGLLFPTVGVHSKNEEIEVNFGQKPFAFRIKENEGWVFIIIAMALLIEVVSAVFEQLGRSLAGMVAAYVGLAVCVVDLRRKAKRERVVWQRRGLIPWYYSRFPNHKLFGSVADYFEVFATVGQSLQSTMGYVFARWHMGNPVRISINMLLFGMFVLVAKLVNKFPVLFNPPPRYHQHNP